MLMRLMTLLMAVLPFITSLQAGVLDSWAKSTPVPPPMIDILLMHDQPGTVLEVKGKYRLYDPKGFHFISTRFIGKRKYIQALKDGLKWGEEFPGLHQLLIVPDTQEVTANVDGIEYKGSIYVYDVEGSLGVVNQVDIEDYLQSTLTPAIQESLPKEVLAAIAITARTEAYYQSQHPKSSYWSVDGSQVGYKGHALANPNSPIGQAIINTRYLTMSQSGNGQTPLFFPSQFGNQGSGETKSLITLQEAIQMAEKGHHAGEILAKAFPGTSIVLMH